MLVESLRTWGGSCAQAPVYAFAPRPGFQPEPATLERLEALDVRLIDEPLVDRFADEPTYNKVAVSAWAERELDHETLVFTDTDCVFLGEPAELVGGDWVAALRPVDRRIAGSRGKGKNEPYWRKMYAELEVEGEPFVRTTVGQMEIRAYWNSGLVGRAAQRRPLRRVGARAQPAARRRSGVRQVAALHGPAQPAPRSPPTSTTGCGSSPTPTTTRCATAPRSTPEAVELDLGRPRPRPLPALVPHARRPREGEPPVRPGERPVRLARRAPAARADGRGRGSSPPAASSRA